jgi:hypothetical protein
LARSAESTLDPRRSAKSLLRRRRPGATRLARDLRGRASQQARGACRGVAGRRRRCRRRRTGYDASGLAIRRLGIAGHHAVCNDRSLRQPDPSFGCSTLGRCTLGRCTLGRCTLGHGTLRNGGIDCRRNWMTCPDTLGQKSADTLALSAIDVDILGLLWTHADSFKRTFKRGYGWGAASIDCLRCR